MIGNQLREVTQVMKNSLIILSLILLSAACHTASSKTNTPQDDLYIRVTTEQSEHSMDSNSETTTLTVAGDTLAYEQGHSGAHSRERGSVEKKFRLSAEDKNCLGRILNEKNLLVTKMISKPLETTGPRSYHSLSISIKSKLNGKEGSISIDGPIRSTAIKNDPLCQDSLLLIKELYRIINRTEPLLGFAEFTDDNPNER
jgi:hypothetical protein